MAAKQRVAHRFGGVWTEIKLRALTEYLHFYQNALKNKGFETWYVDAFAGTGDRHTELEEGGIFDGGPIERVERILDGSARKALRIMPPFAHYRFNEKHQGRAKQLTALRAEFPYDIEVAPGEANAFLRSIFESGNWISGTNRWRQRAVVFLDPYGMSVDWSTLSMLAGIKQVDVWYLFPRKAVVQQLARNSRGLDVGKRRRLNEIFGTDDWEAEFYKSRPKQGVLFGDVDETEKDRVVNSEEICGYARQRLASLFCYVSPPLPLIAGGRDLFELYCLSNNGPAIPLIRKGVDHVISKYTPASRRRCGL